MTRTNKEPNGELREKLKDIEDNLVEVKGDLRSLPLVVIELRALRTELVQALTKHLPDGHIPLEIHRQAMETTSRHYRVSMWVMACLFFGSLVVAKLIAADFFVNAFRQLLG